MIDEQKTWKERLKILGVSQRDFAEMISEDEAVLCQYLNNKREPRIKKFIKISETIKSLEQGLG